MSHTLLFIVLRIWCVLSMGLYGSLMNLIMAINNLIAIMNIVQLALITRFGGTHTILQLQALEKGVQNLSAVKIFLMNLEWAVSSYVH